MILEKDVRHLPAWGVGSVEIVVEIVMERWHPVYSHGATSPSRDSVRS
jgi:hypothetical protein